MILNKNLWGQLSARGRSDSGLLVLRLYPESKFNIFVALDPLTGHRYLLLDSIEKKSMANQKLPAGRGFAVKFVNALSKGRGDCICFELTDLNFADVFDVIGNDVLKVILGAKNEKSAMDLFILKIFEWQKFLNQRQLTVLSEQEQQGLFGELWFIREVLFGSISKENAIQSWVGPTALTKDFQFSEVAFEVKTSSAKQHTHFSISSELQLDPSNVKRLILFCILLERLAAGGISLPEIIVLIREDLKELPVVAAVFAEKLLSAGYQDSDAVQYVSRFAIRSQHFFNVVDDFPRIVENDLRAGVGDVRYSILLSECLKYSVEEKEMQRMLRVCCDEN